MQRHENIKLDPKLQHDCEEDVNNFCKGIQRGKGEVSLKTYLQYCALNIRVCDCFAAVFPS